MEKLNTFLNYNFQFGNDIHISVKGIMIVLVVFILTSYILKLLKTLLNKRLRPEDSVKFKTVFSFAKYFIYLVVLLITFDNMGINVTAILAASTAYLVILYLLFIAEINKVFRTQRFYWYCRKRLKT